MSETTVTAETIKRANALETHPSAGQRIAWDDYELLGEPSDNRQIPELALIIRVTYADSQGNPDLDSDHAMWSRPADDWSVNDARQISAYPDVWGTAVYLTEPDSGASDSVPIAMFQDGRRVDS